MGRNKLGARIRAKLSRTKSSAAATSSTDSSSRSTTNSSGFAKPPTLRTLSTTQSQDSKIPHQTAPRDQSPPGCNGRGNVVRPLSAVSGESVKDKKDSNSVKSRQQTPQHRPSSSNGAAASEKSGARTSSPGGDASTDAPDEPDSTGPSTKMQAAASDNLEAIKASDMTGKDLQTPSVSSTVDHKLSPTVPSTNGYPDAADTAAPPTHGGRAIDPQVDPLDSLGPLSAGLGSQTLTPRPTRLPWNLNPSITPTASTPDTGVTTGPPSSDRRQSLFPNRQTTLIRALLSAAQAEDLDLDKPDQLLPVSGKMLTRKIWVRRPGSSPTLVSINEDDLVDDVRDMILRKYSNSLGRQFDAPDLTIRLVPREQRQDRMLSPEEPMARTMDAYFPGGQTVDEALIIDIPLRRTPRLSPRGGPPHAAQIAHPVYYDESRPLEAGTDYFGPAGLVPAAHSPGLVVATHASGTPTQTHSIAVLNTGLVPAIPSPGGTRSKNYRDRPDRPRLGRQHTSSPTILNLVSVAHPPTNGSTAGHGSQPANNRHPRSRTQSNASSEHSTGAPAPAAPTIPTPPAPPPTIPEAAATIQRVATPPPRVASPRPTTARPKKKKTSDIPSLPAGLLNGGVPPISVLIVEDNIINLKLLEAFVKRLKVRWQTAMNGRDAVHKWRTGGFHLVLMDIQLPVMNGLEATREIRRLERVNSIGVFSSSGGKAADEPGDGPEEKDRLPSKDLFKSPVIIVALTASSLQSDRHEALAAGCNDFLTKPVNFVWLERKVMEWGCMQALIDFDGWRKWKDTTHAPVEAEAAKKAATKAKAKKNRQSLTSMTVGA